MATELQKSKLALEMAYGMYPECRERLEAFTFRQLAGAYDIAAKRLIMLASLAKVATPGLYAAAELVCKGEEFDPTTIVVEPQSFKYRGNRITIDPAKKTVDFSKDGNVFARHEFNSLKNEKYTYFLETDDFENDEPVEPWILATSHGNLAIMYCELNARMGQLANACEAVLPGYAAAIDQIRDGTTFNAGLATITPVSFTYKNIGYSLRLQTHELAVTTP